MRVILCVTSFCALTACAEFDMQGEDPRDHYAANPIVNKVETRYLSQLVHFISPDEMDAKDLGAMKTQFGQVSPMAVESIEVQLHPSQMRNMERRQVLKKALVKLGMPGKAISYVGAEEVRAQDANVQLTYAAVVSPRCPDWGTSSTSNNSNMIFTPNISCANITNLGLMVADPRDLVEGQGTGVPDAQNTTDAIRKYHGVSDSSSSSDDSTSGTSTDTSSTGQ